MMGLSGYSSEGANRTKGFDIVQDVARSRDDLKIMVVTPTNVSDDRLMIYRNIPNEKMPLHYSAADFFFFPSRYESVGYTALEAMSCDLPVVASRTGSLRGHGCDLHRQDSSHLSTRRLFRGDRYRVERWFPDT